MWGIIIYTTRTCKCTHMLHVHVCDASINMYCNTWTWTFLKMSSILILKLICSNGALWISVNRKKKSLRIKQCFASIYHILHQNTNIWNLAHVVTCYIKSFTPIISHTCISNIIDLCFKSSVKIMTWYWLNLDINLIDI